MKELFNFFLLRGGDERILMHPSYVLQTSNMNLIYIHCRCKKILHIHPM